jgi:hypothetical protein
MQMSNTYPVEGATYKHMPKFIDRMKDAEGESPKPFTGGALSGVGRLEKAEHMGGKPVRGEE